MKKTFESGRIEDAVLNGDFGPYLQKPISSKERTELVGERMALCRKKAGLSQTDVCSIIGIAPQTYSGYENGKHEPTLETLVRLSYLYNVSLDFLLDRNDDSEEFYRLAEEHENIEENDNLKELAVDIHFLKEEIAELKKQIKK